MSTSISIRRSIFSATWSSFEESRHAVSQRSTAHIRQGQNGHAQKVPDPAQLRECRSADRARRTALSLRLMRRQIAAGSALGLFTRVGVVLCVWAGLPGLWLRMVAMVSGGAAPEHRDEERSSPGGQVGVVADTEHGFAELVGEVFGDVVVPGLGSAWARSGKRGRDRRAWCLAKSPDPASGVNFAGIVLGVWSVFRVAGSAACRGCCHGVGWRDGAGLAALAGCRL